MNQRLQNKNQELEKYTYTYGVVIARKSSRLIVA